MTKSQCPRCGAQANGNFCASCGAGLAKRHCNECGTAAQPGARFCNTCGTPVAGQGGSSAPPPSQRAGAQAAGAQAAGTSASSESVMGWWIAGVMLVALMGVVAYPILRQDEVALQPPAQTGGLGPASAIDLSSMTPRQAADQLYDRVMRTAAAGDSASVVFFVPMAISAYANAEPLDTDGLFHLSTLQRTAGLFEEGIATADRALAILPNHLLSLYAKGESQMGMGDTTAAIASFTQLLDAWTAERDSNYQDYLDHSNMLPDIQTRAQEVVNGG